MNRFLLALLGIVLITPAVWAQKPKITVTGTGRTTPHVVYTTVVNTTSQSLAFQIPAGLIETGVGYQDYLVPEPTTVTVPGNTTQTFEVPVFCTDVRLPSPPAGTVLPTPDQWNTKTPLIKTVQDIDLATTTLQQNNTIETPLSDTPELEQTTLIQQTLWVQTAPADKPYTMGDMCDNLHKQFETAAGTPIATLTAPEMAALDLGIAQLIDAVGQIGRTAELPAFTLPALPPSATQLRDAPVSTNPAVTNTLRAKGTGRTTGHICDIFITNPTPNPVTVYFGPDPAGAALYIPSSGKYQPYVVPFLPPVTVEPGATRTVPVQGFCTDVRTPPVPAGGDMPPVSQWISATPHPGLEHQAGAPRGGVTVPTRTALPLSEAVAMLQTAANAPLPAFYTTMPNSDCAGLPQRFLPVATLPGTNQPITIPIDANKYPAATVPLLLDAIQRIPPVYDNFKKQGAVTTPFSGNPEKEREAVIQQSFWLYTAALTGNDYKKSDFRDNTIRQFEENTGKVFSEIPQPQQDQMDKGVDDFWNSFQAVGAEAKILSRPAETPETAPPVDNFWKAYPAGKGKPGDLVTEPDIPIEPIRTIVEPGEGPILVEHKDDCKCGEVSFKVTIWHMKPEKDPKKQNQTNYKSAQSTKANASANARPGQKAEDIKGGLQGIKKGDRVVVSIEDIKMQCPCSNGTECETFKDAEEAKAKQDAVAEEAAINKKVNPKLEKAQKELDKAKADHDTAVKAGKRKSETDRLQKKVDAVQAKVDGLQKIKDDAAQKVADSTKGVPSVKEADGKNDATGKWEGKKFTFESVEKTDAAKKVELTFQLSYICIGAGCTPAQCSRTFTVKVEE